MAEGLADLEGVDALPDHEHSRRVLEHVRMPEGLGQVGFLGDLAEEPEYCNSIHFGGLLRVENEVICIGGANGFPNVQRGLLIEKAVALDSEKPLRGMERAFQPRNVNLLILEVDIAEPQVADFRGSCAVRDSEQEHCVFPWPEFSCGLQEVFKLFFAHVRDSSPNLLGSLLRHSDDVLENRWCHGGLHDERYQSNVALSREIRNVVRWLQQTLQRNNSAGSFATARAADRTPH